MAISNNTEWAAAPGTDDGALVGRDTTSKVGFFGSAPVVRPVVPLTTPTVQQVIDALIALGLVTQSD